MPIGQKNKLPAVILRSRRELLLFYTLPRPDPPPAGLVPRYPLQKPPSKGLEGSGGEGGGADEGLKVEGGFTFGRLQGRFKGASRRLQGGLKGA